MDLDMGVDMDVDMDVDMYIDTGVNQDIQSAIKKTVTVEKSIEYGQSPIIKESTSTRIVNNITDFLFSY